MKNAEEKDLNKNVLSESEAESSELLEALDQFSHPEAVHPVNDQEEKKPVKALPFLVMEENPQALQSLDDVKHNHLKFHLTAVPGQGKNKSPEIKNLIPALSFPFTDTSQLRFDFPLILKNDGREWIISLKDFIDEQLSASELNSDEKGHLKQGLLKLELLIKTLSEKKPVLNFRETWEKAVNILLNAQNSKSVKKDAVKENISAVYEKIDSADRLISFSAENVLPIFAASRFHTWQKLISPYAAELEDLQEKLTNILQANNSGSGEEYSKEALQESMGKTGYEEVDFSSFSEIVGSSFRKESLPKVRVDRIKDILTIINKWLRIVSSPENIEKYLAKLEADTTQKALSLYQKQKEELIDFFKALRMARLEKEHRFDEEMHGSFFKEFSSLYLSEEEWACFPPVFMNFKASKIKSADKADLVDILSSKLPIKVILQVDDLYNSSAVFDESFFSPGWSAVLGKMALGLNNSFVLQFPLSYTVQVKEEIEQGILFNGPSLYSVYDGFDQTTSFLNPYLRSASASDSRAFPLFSFIPTGDKDWADSFSIAKSSQADAIWPENILKVMDGDKEHKQSIHYNLAHFLAGIERYNNHFLPVSRSEWHEEMVPLTDYINPDFSNSGSSVPYISMADKNGILYRALVTKTLCNLCLEAKSLWRNLQEMSGINNSHVEKQVAVEKKKIEETLSAEIEKLKSEHKSEMDRNLKELTDEIISNIAGGLLSDEFISIGSGAASQAPKEKTAQQVNDPKESSPAEKPVEAKQPEPEPEEEEMAFNDPYIDTPLCTSCNDCRNINSQMFAYDENKQAFIKDPKAGTFKELVMAAEKCPVRIIHPGKPLNPDEPGLDELVKIAEKYN